MKQEDQSSFQARVEPWLVKCFGLRIASDQKERNHRFLEEALELVQACGLTADEAHQLVDYTFGRPLGDPTQEVGGAMVTLAALCLANGLDMHEAGETELRRINEPEVLEKIRAKQASKPKHSPLPEKPALDVPAAPLLQPIEQVQNSIIPTDVVTQIFDRTVPFTYQAFARNLLKWLNEQPPTTLIIKYY